VAGAEAEAEDGRESEAEGVPLTVIIKLIIYQVIFIILATFKKKKWSKPLRVRSKGMVWRVRVRVVILLPLRKPLPLDKGKGF